MRIRTKIALIYTLLTSLVLMGAFAVVYLLTLNHAQRDFYALLWERAMIAAEVRYEEDEKSPNDYRALLDKSKFVLNEEKISIFSLNDEHIGDSLRRVITSEQEIKELLNGKTLEFRRGKIFYVGAYYPDNEDNVIILASAIDSTSANSLQNLLDLLLVILISSTVLVYFLGLFYAKNVLSPIVSIIAKVKSITANNLNESLKKEGGSDELSELSQTFNSMIVRLRHSFDMQNSFIRNASHELRNPLTAILGEAEIALSKPRTESEYVATLETVLEESERLNVMIKDLLALAQTDFDFSRIPKKEVNVVRLIEKVGLTFHGVNINIEIKGDRESYTTAAASSLLYMALINIIGNAVKFSDSKPVDINFSYRLGSIVVEVRDRGIGIPRNELKNVFHPFYRAQNTASYKGTGIGLALAQRVIFLHKGKLCICSDSGKGTLVWIILSKNGVE